MNTNSIANEIPINRSDERSPAGRVPYVSPVLVRLSLRETDGSNITLEGDLEVPFGGDPS